MLFKFVDQLALKSEICFTPINNLRQTKGDTKDRKLLSINLSIFKQTMPGESFHLACVGEFNLNLCVSGSGLEFEYFVSASIDLNDVATYFVQFDDDAEWRRSLKVKEIFFNFY